MIRQVILDQIAAFKLAPREINNGRCIDFARAVFAECSRRGEHGVLVVDVAWFDLEWANGTRSRDLWHAWVYLDGRWYDAERPDGVEDWETLPFFDRWRSDGVSPRRAIDEQEWISKTAAFHKRLAEAAALESGAYVGPASSPNAPAGSSHFDGAILGSTS